MGMMAPSGSVADYNRCRAQDNGPSSFRVERRRPTFYADWHVTFNYPVHADRHDSQPPEMAPSDVHALPS